MLAGVNFADKTAQLLSIPRDLWVQLPNLTPSEGRINTAYPYGEQSGIGGPQELMDTIAQNFGLRIDRYVVINFIAFEQGIDAIGGIDINIPEPLHDDHYPLRDGSGTIAIDFPEGLVHMDGRTALIYARIRHDSSDFKRMRRQQQVIFAARDKLLSVETLPYLPALTQVLISSARTNLTLDDLALLGCVAPQIERANITNRIIGTDMTTPVRTESGAQVLMPKMDVILPVLQMFNEGQ
jgi:LCP family protein required for cell wall assembly